MVKHLIGFVGTSEAGKSSLGCYLSGLVLSKLHDSDGKPAITNWRLNEHGKLEIETDNYVPEDDKWETTFSELDVDNRSADFQMWARGGLWVWAKTFSLARPMKEACKNLLGLTYNQLYGTGKNTETKYTWGNFAPFLDSTERKRIKAENLTDVFMTAREVLVHYGTSIMRVIDPDIYVKRLAEQLQKETSHIGIVTDIRRANEAKILKENGCVLIRLLRGQEPNISEADINEVVADYTIDNKNLTLLESCEHFNSIIEELKLFEKPAE